MQKQFLYILVFFFICITCSLYCDEQNLPAIKNVIISPNEANITFYKIFSTTTTFTKLINEIPESPKEKKVEHLPDVMNALDILVDKYGISNKPNSIPKNIKMSNSSLSQNSVKMGKQQTATVQQSIVKKEPLMPLPVSTLTPALEIAKKEQTSSEDATKAEEPEEKVDINKATIEVLMSNLGLDYERARSIVQYRKYNGDFKEINEINNVFGITDTIFEQMLPHIKI